MAAPEEALILKLLAESQLCHVLILGSALLAVVNLVHLSLQFALDRLIWEGILLVIIPLCWGISTTLYRYYVNDTVIAWLSIYLPFRLSRYKTDVVDANESRGE